MYEEVQIINQATFYHEEKPLYDTRTKLILITKQEFIVCKPEDIGNGNSRDEKNGISPPNGCIVN